MNVRFNPHFPNHVLVRAQRHLILSWVLGAAAEIFVGKSETFRCRRRHAITRRFRRAAILSFRQHSRSCICFFDRKTWRAKQRLAVPAVAGSSGRANARLRLGARDCHTHRTLL
jgi:hypothetical protein